jgi:dihydrolipoamide dehydrogenase
LSPQAGEWIHYITTAVREELPVERLLDTVAQFPTFSGALIEALEQLDL